MDATREARPAETPGGPWDRCDGPDQAADVGADVLGNRMTFPPVYARRSTIFLSPLSLLGLRRSAVLMSLTLASDGTTVTMFITPRP
ncbi:hypothetical protein ACWEQG_31070 [Microbispora sp. NPDC004025]